MNSVSSMVYRAESPELADPRMVLLPPPATLTANLGRLWGGRDTFGVYYVWGRIESRAQTWM